MRREQISSHNYYHIYNRGIARQNIFLDDDDRIRFLFLIIYLQSPIIFPQINRIVTTFKKVGRFEVDAEITKAILRNRYLNLITFALMPNHFHLIVYDRRSHGTSHFMQRVQNSYTKYFNQKYKERGHLFQGPFHAIKIDNENDLKNISAFIHRNPRTLPGWKGKEHIFPFSSMPDFLGDQRFENLLTHEIISNKFPSPKEYREFVNLFEKISSDTPLPQKHLFE